MASPRRIFLECGGKPAAAGLRRSAESVIPNSNGTFRLNFAYR
jgi:hypothetical protein